MLLYVGVIFCDALVVRNVCFVFVHDPMTLADNMQPSAAVNSDVQDL